MPLCLNFKKYLLIFLLANIFLAHGAAYAQTDTSVYDYKNKAGVSKQIQDYLCAPTEAPADKGSTPIIGASTAASKNAASGDLYNCINRLYKFSLILASCLAILFIVIAGYVYMSAEGNQEAVDKAKSILTTSLTALVILFGGYVLLRAINPDLIQFKSIQPPSVSLQPAAVPGAVTPGAGAPSTSVSAAAQTIRSMDGSKLTINSTRCDCPNNCPSNTLQALANGQLAQKDGPGSTCNAGTTSVNITMLNALITAANNGNNFIIESLTGGHHSSASDPHTLGNAVDVIPQPANASNQSKLVASLRSSGASKIGLECNGGYTSLTGSNDSSTACIGQKGYHIHAQW